MKRIFFWNNHVENDTLKILTTGLKISQIFKKSEEAAVSFTVSCTTSILITNTKTILRKMTQCAVGLGQKEDQGMKQEEKYVVWGQTPHWWSLESSLRWCACLIETSFNNRGWYMTQSRYGRCAHRHRAEAEAAELELYTMSRSWTVDIYTEWNS